MTNILTVAVKRIVGKLFGKTETPLLSKQEAIISEPVAIDKVSPRVERKVEPTVSRQQQLRADSASRMAAQRRGEATSLQQSAPRTKAQPKAIPYATPSTMAEHTSDTLTPLAVGYALGAFGSDSCSGDSGNSCSVSSD